MATLTALTYNLCWWCADGQNSDCSGSAGAAANIDLAAKTRGGLAIVALQEIVRLAEVAASSQCLRGLRGYAAQDGPELIATFVDSALLKVCGRCQGNDAEPGRPFLLLFASLRQDPQHLLLILNVHAAHRADFAADRIDRVCDFTLATRPKLLRKVQSSRTISCVALGDWNDEGKNLWQGLVLFGSSRFLPTLSLSAARPPKSCCYEGSSRLDHISDYTMVSAPWSWKQQNALSELACEAASDHRPVTAQVCCPKE